MQYTARGLGFTTTAEAGPGTRRAAVPIPPSHHGHDLERWPLHSALTLAAIEGSVPSARAHARQLLCEWGQAEVNQDAGAVITELVANAVVASAGLGPAAAPVLVWLGSNSHCVLLAVADASPWPPVRLSLELDAEGGRGLALVETLSSRWGWHLTSITGLRKVVWAEWRLPSEAGQRPATSLPGRCHAVLPARAAVTSRPGAAGDRDHAGHVGRR